MHSHHWPHLRATHIRQGNARLSAMIFGTLNTCQALTCKERQTTNVFDRLVDSIGNLANAEEFQWRPQATRSTRICAGHDFSTTSGVFQLLFRSQRCNGSDCKCVIFRKKARKQGVQLSYAFARSIWEQAQPSAGAEERQRKVQRVSSDLENHVPARPRSPSPLPLLVIPASAWARHSRLLSN